MVVEEISLAPAIVGVMVGSIIFVATIILKLNHRLGRRLTFSFLQLMIFVTFSALICIVGGLLIRGDSKAEVIYESETTIRQN